MLKYVELSLWTDEECHEGIDGYPNSDLEFSDGGEEICAYAEVMFQ